MNFNLNKSTEILQRTPFVLETMLKNVSEEWIMQNEGKETWSPFDVVGHLIHGEKTDWIPRLELILSTRRIKKFEPFDRFAQFEQSKGKTMYQLLAEFKKLRKKNIWTLTSKNLTEADLKKMGVHPAFGNVTVKELLSTWVVHDLNHLAQIARVMAKQYKNETGPWEEYLPILK
jgi:hypothetical protein